MTPQRSSVERLLGGIFLPVDAEADDRAVRQWQNQRRFLVYLTLPFILTVCAIAVLVAPSTWFLPAGSILIWTLAFVHACFCIRRAKRDQSLAKRR